MSKRKTAILKYKIKNKRIMVLFTHQGVSEWSIKTSMRYTFFNVEI